MQIPREDDYTMLHATHFEFGGRMPRRTVNASYYALDIDGATAGSHKSIQMRRTPTNPANPIYQPLGRPSSAGLAASKARVDARRTRGEHELTDPTIQQPLRSSISKMWEANERALNRPAPVRIRQHFRKTNSVEDIEGAQTRTGARTSEGVLSRRQTNPIVPEYSWDEGRAEGGRREEGGGRHSSGGRRNNDGGQGEAPIERSHDVFGIPRHHYHDSSITAPRSRGGRRVRLETHLGPGMMLVTVRARELAPGLLGASSGKNIELGGGSRSEEFAQTMAASRSYFHTGEAQAATASSCARRGPLTPPPHDPSLMIARSLCNTDMPATMAHRAHRAAAGEPMRQRRAVRNPMVTIQDDDHVLYSGLQLPSMRAQPGVSAALQLATQLAYERSLSGR
jgi:hypothetical protein